MREVIQTAGRELPLIHAEAIPAAIKSIPHWVTWAYEPRPQGGKPFKKPLTPHGTPADVTNPHTWSSFDYAIKAYTTHPKFNGVAFVFTKDNAIVGVDIDGCIVNDQLTPDAQEISYLLDSYTERSPSGVGLRILVEAEVGDFAGKRRGGLELYNYRRYLTITGNRLSDKPAHIQPRLAELREVYRRYLSDTSTRPAPATLERPQMQASDGDIIERMFNGKLGELYREIFSGDISHVQGGDESRADTLLLNGLAFYTNCDSAQMRRIILSSPRTLQRIAKWGKAVSGKITYLDYQIGDSISYTLNHRR